MRYLINREANGSPYLRRIKTVLMAIVLLHLAFNNNSSITSVEAAGNQVDVRVDYIEEIAVVSAGTGGSIKFYMSTDNKKTWEMIEATGVVDLSGLMVAKESIVYFKGNRQTEPYALTIPAEDSSLKVTYQITDGVGKIVFSNPTAPVEYRKGANGAWKTAVNNMSTSIYEIKGATLYFRYPATAGKRAGKIVTVKIPKRPAAPSVTLDGSRLYINGLKNGVTQYRVGDSTNWTTFTSPLANSKTFDLRLLLAPTSTINTPIPAGVVEFRTVGDTKKVASSIKVLEIPVQPTVPDTISLTASTLRITDTNTKRAYEYTRVDRNAALNLTTAKWTTITAARSVVIPKAAVGDKIYVRLKSTIDPTTKQVIPASTYRELIIQTITIR